MPRKLNPHKLTDCTTTTTTERTNTLVGYRITKTTTTHHNGVFLTFWLIYFHNPFFISSSLTALIIWLVIHCDTVGPWARLWPLCSISNDSQSAKTLGSTLMYRTLVSCAPLAIIAARSYIVRVVMVSTMRAMPKETIGNHQNLCLMLRMLEKQPQ